MSETNFKPVLGLWDATMIVAGSMIGSGIFIVSADIVRNVGSAGWLKELASAPAGPTGSGMGRRFSECGQPRGARHNLHRVAAPPRHRSDAMTTSC